MVDLGKIADSVSEISDRNADSLSNISDSLSNVSDSLSIPYIENGKERNLNVTRARENLFSKKLLLEAVDNSFINRTPHLNLADGFPLPCPVPSKINSLQKCADCFRDAQSCWCFDTQMPRAAPCFVRVAFLMRA